tara:strand:- start:5406 stop:6098 length:693 start_codon:yes stop_codon:yes gene_type:complete
MRNIAVIPARAGSTRLKDKNVYPLGGKPLIRWTTEAVIDSGCFDSILISTDSDKIFSAVSDLPVLRHHRPAEHATVRATALGAMLHIVDDIARTDSPDTFSYFLPTCPFVSSEDIRSGMKKLKSPNSSADSVVSMTMIPETIQLACVMRDDLVLPVFDNLECGLTNSKFIKKYYKPSGAFYMSNFEYIRKSRNYFTGNVKGVIIPENRSVDINNLADIEYAESLLGGLHE